jgi:hypothetical protein
VEKSFDEQTTPIFDEYFLPKIFFQDLIRFPYEFVVYNHTFLSSLESNCGHIGLAGHAGQVGQDGPDGPAIQASHAGQPGQEDAAVGGGDDYYLRQVRRLLVWGQCYICMYDDHNFFAIFANILRKNSFESLYIDLFKTNFINYTMK